MKIFKFTTLLLIALSACTVKPEQQKEQDVAQAQKPNVLLLYMDDLRPQLNSYEQKQIHSPNIDALAAKGVRFDNAYCNIAVCGASRASMMTGMLPTKTRFVDYKTRVSEEAATEVTLPQLFKNNGYRTISNGKIYHHLDDRQQDWDEMWRPYAYDKNDKGLSPLDYWQSLWRDYQLPDNRKEYQATDRGPSYESADVPDSTYIDGLMTEKVIRDLYKLKDSNKPFFLTAGFIAPHLPFNAPTKYWDMYDKESIKLPKNNFVPKNAPKVSLPSPGEFYQYSDIPRDREINDEEAKVLIHGYYATVSYVDALIGKIMGTLKTLEMDKNTIVVLVADHGYNLQEHRLWGKWTSHRTAMRVPLIIRTPEMMKGAVANGLVDLTDVYPTLAELCSLEAPKEQLAGQSLVPILNDPSAKGKDKVFARNRLGYSIITPEYSYTEFIKAEEEKPFAKTLYDYTKDINENENVAGDENYKETVNKLSNILHTEYASNVAPVLKKTASK